MTSDAAATGALDTAAEYAAYERGEFGGCPAPPEVAAASSVFVGPAALVRPDDLPYAGVPEGADFLRSPEEWPFDLGGGVRAAFIRRKRREHMGRVARDGAYFTEHLRVRSDDPSLGGLAAAGWEAD